jgi:uncharacterized phage protein (TIGR01671 family)
MKEIKYRAFRANPNPVMYYFTLENLIFSRFNKQPLIDFELVRETTMRYTGLKDKYGKEIYEGDILTSNQYPFQDDGKYNYHGVVEWGDEYGAFFLTKRLVNSEKRGISHGISETLMDYDMASFEVIGNIYEKPDLLEGHSHVPSV